MANDITLRVEGLNEANARLKRLAQVLPDKTDRLIEDAGEMIFADSQRLVPVDTGMLQRSGSHIHKKMQSEVGYNTPYACLIGGQQKVFCKGGYTEAKAIQKGADILTKDGEFHEGFSFKTGTFEGKPIGIILKCKKGRGSLFVTADHLILTMQEGLPVFVRADALREGDLVWHKRKIPYNKGTGKIIEKTCPSCSLTFKSPANSKNKYCSKVCYHALQKGRIMPENERQKHTGWKKPPEARMKIAGCKNPAWKGGTSKLPYGPEWNRILKEQIRERDSFVCRLCGKNESRRAHSVYHIDGNKFNNSKENLMTLCISCHGKQQHQDCELVDVNTEMFEAVLLVGVKRVCASNFKGSAKKTILWDVNVQDENSFYVCGMLIHNSAVHDGTSSQQAQPFLRQAVEINLPRINKKIEELGKE